MKASLDVRNLSIIEIVSLEFRLREHSQTIAIRHPELCNDAITLLSLNVFSESLRCQNKVRVLGILKYLHPEWACQKHPWMNIATFHFRRTKSGFPIIELG